MLGDERAANGSLDKERGLHRVPVISGFLVGFGYLFLLIMAAAKPQEAFLFKKATVISLAAVAMLAGGAAVGTGMLLRGFARALALGGLGLLALMLGLALSWHMLVAPSLGILYGANGLTAAGFALLVLTLAGLHARRQRTDSLLIRFILGGTAGAALILYFVQLLVCLADDTSASLLSVAFRSGRAVTVIYAIASSLLVISLLIVSVVAAAGTRNVNPTVRGGLVLAQVLMWLAVVFDAATFIQGLAGGSEFSPVSAQILEFVRGTMGTLVPLVATVLLCAMALSSVLVTTAPAGGPRRPPAATSGAPRPAEAKDAPLSPAPSGGGGASLGIEEQLLKLKRLREQDLISEEEFQNKRRELLDKL